MSESNKPHSLRGNGIVVVIDERGRERLYHSDANELHAFIKTTDALSAGRDELHLLLHSNTTPAMVARRQADGRTDAELRADWLTKVTTAGMAEADALAFLERRIALEN